MLCSVYTTIAGEYDGPPFCIILTSQKLKLFLTVPTSAWPQHCHSSTQHMHIYYVPSANDIKKKEQPDYHLYASLRTLPNPFKIILSHLRKYVY